MIEQKTISTQAWIALFALGMIWGASFLAYAVTLRELPIFTLVAHRVLWGCLVLWGVVFALRIPLPKHLSNYLALLGMGVFNNVIPFSLIAFGQQTIESGLASILNATSAFFTIALAALVFADERLTQSKIIGTIFSFIGVIVIIGWESLFHFESRTLAILALLGSSCSYAIAAVWARSFLQGIHPIMAATGMLTASSLVMIILALSIDGAPVLNLQFNTWAAVLFLAIPATAIAYLLYYRALALAGSGNFSLVTLLVAPSAVFWGWLILDETLDINAYLGFALIGLGMVIVDGRLLKRLKSNRKPV